MRLNYFNPEFLPPEQMDPQLRRLGLTLPRNGSADAELSVRLFGKRIDSSLLHMMTQRRVQQLKAELAAEPQHSDSQSKMKL